MDKRTWRLRPRGRPVRVRYCVYAERAHRPHQPPRRDARLLQRGDPVPLRGGASRSPAPPRRGCAPRLERLHRARAHRWRLAGPELRRPGGQPGRGRPAPTDPVRGGRRAARGGGVGRDGGREQARRRSRGRVRRGGGALGRPADAALPLPALPRRQGTGRARARRVDGAHLSTRADLHVQGLGGLPHPRLARVLPPLEREAAQAARLRSLRLLGRELHPVALGLRGHHLVLRQSPGPPCRSDERRALPGAAGRGVLHARGDARPPGADPGGRLAHRLGQVLPAGRAHTEQRDLRTT